MKPKLKREEPKVKPEFKMLDDPIDLRTMDTNIIVDYLEDQIKLRDQKVEEHLRSKLKQNK